jgi:hypothetical protein
MEQRPLQLPADQGAGSMARTGRLHWTPRRPLPPLLQTETRLDCPHTATEEFIVTGFGGLPVHIVCVRACVCACACARAADVAGAATSLSYFKNIDPLPGHSSSSGFITGLAPFRAFMAPTDPRVNE